MDVLGQLIVLIHIAGLQCLRRHGFRRCTFQECPRNPMVESYHMNALSTCHCAVNCASNVLCLSFAYDVHTRTCIARGYEQQKSTAVTFPGNISDFKLFAKSGALNVSSTTSQTTALTRTKITTATPTTSSTTTTTTITTSTTTTITTTTATTTTTTTTTTTYDYARARARARARSRGRARDRSPTFIAICSDGSRPFKKKTCYTTYNGEFTFARGDNVCRDASSYMAEITTGDIDAFLNKYLIGKYPKCVWIGAKKLSDGWTWMASEYKMVFNNWLRSPINTCAAILTSGKWDSYNCNQHCSVLCENGWRMQYGDLFHFETCMGSGKAYGDWCYLYVNRELNWTNAEKRCKQMKMNLVVISNSDEQRFVREYLDLEKVYCPMHVWIGLSDRKKEGRFVWNSTGEKMTYNNFAPNQPSGRAEREVCVAISIYENYKWTNRNCNDTKEMSFLCQTRWW